MRAWNSYTLLHQPAVGSDLPRRSVIHPATIDLRSAIMSTTEIETRDPGAPMRGSTKPGGILRYLAFVGLAFVLLMVALEPDVGFSAPPAARLLFWSLQITTGLLVLEFALRLLTRFRGASRFPNGFWVLLSGVLGAAVLAPIYWLIGEGLMEAWLGFPALPEEDGSKWIGMASSSPMLNEFLDIVGPVTAAWALICLPRLNGIAPPLLTGREGPGMVAGQPSAPAAVTPTDLMPHATVTSPPPAPIQPVGAGETAQQRATWRERLPSELGTDVIAVASELQYLRVWTTRGNALILGALADVESEDASLGFRVHRSWWVAAEHVVSVRRTASGVICLMSDGRQVPVSRRRSAQVITRFGDGASYRVADASETVTEADLH
jgi:hypothetical protein